MNTGYHYPTEANLKKIAEWPYEDPLGWFGYIENIWWMPDWGIRRVRSRVYMSTGGWSGNEEIIGAMQKNFILWNQLFYSHRTGGHYVFIVRKSIAKGMAK